MSLTATRSSPSASSTIFSAARPIRPRPLIPTVGTSLTTSRPRSSRSSVATQSQRRVVDGGQAGEREGGEHEPEVAQRDVVVAGVGQEVDDDAGQPAGDDVG